jgi:hypothetical protein
MDQTILNKKMLDLLKYEAQVYNEGRLHRDFQAAEVDKFVEWLYKQYGYELEKN